MNLMSYFSVELKGVALIRAASNKIQSSRPEFQRRRNERQRLEKVVGKCGDMINTRTRYQIPAGILTSDPELPAPCPSLAPSDQKSQMNPWIFSDTGEKNNAQASGASESRSSRSKWRRWQRSRLDGNVSLRVHANTSDTAFHPRNASAMFSVWSRDPQEVWGFEKVQTNQK